MKEGFFQYYNHMKKELQTLQYLSVAKHSKINSRMLGNNTTNIGGNDIKNNTL